MILLSTGLSTYCTVMKLSDAHIVSNYCPHPIRSSLIIQHQGTLQGMHDKAGSLPEGHGIQPQDRRLLHAHCGSAVNGHQGPSPAKVLPVVRWAISAGVSGRYASIGAQSQRPFHDGSF